MTRLFCESYDKGIAPFMPTNRYHYQDTIDNDNKATQNLTEAPYGSENINKTDPNSVHFWLLFLGGII